MFSYIQRGSFLPPFQILFDNTILVREVHLKFCASNFHLNYVISYIFEFILGPSKFRILIFNYFSKIFFSMNLIYIHHTISFEKNIAVREVHLKCCPGTRSSCIQIATLLYSVFTSYIIFFKFRISEYQYEISPS